MQLLEIPGLAQRMASLMCVDLDVTSDLEEVNDECENGHGKITKRDVEGIIEEEIRQARDIGFDDVMWLELDELDIDDATLCSLDLSNKFPVCSFSIYTFTLFSLMISLEIKMMSAAILCLSSSNIIYFLPYHIQVNAELSYRI